MRPPMKRARENEQGIHSSAENELNTAETKVESEAAKLSTPGSVDINPIARYDVHHHLHAVVVLFGVGV